MENSVLERRARVASVNRREGVKRALVEGMEGSGGESAGGALAFASAGMRRQANSWRVWGGSSQFSRRVVRCWAVALCVFLLGENPERSRLFCMVEGRKRSFLLGKQLRFRMLPPHRS